MTKSLSEELGLKITRHTLRRFLKKLGYTWKRFRKSLKKKQDPIKYAAKLAELKQLLELHKHNYIDLFFSDESGFNLQGYVPYGWQPKGEYIQITPSKTPSVQIFGLMSLDNRLEAYSCKGSMNSETVISFIDDFFQSRKRPTVIVIDNAPIHHSHKFKAKIAEWEKDQFYVFYLPEYSPHLNPIEILWRKIKYEWLKYEDMESQQQLEDELINIINNFGEKYNIDFKEHKEEVSSIFDLHIQQTSATLVKKLYLF